MLASELEKRAANALCSRSLASCPWKGSGNLQGRLPESFPTPIRHVNSEFWVPGVETEMKLILPDCYIELVL
jgi:hypothetical protein